MMEKNKVKVTDHQILNTTVSVSLFGGHSREYEIYNSLAEILNDLGPATYRATGVVLSKSGALGILTEDLETVFFTVEQTEA